MARRLLPRSLRALAPLMLGLGIASPGWLHPAARAEPEQALAILLQQLEAKPLGLYDGMRLFHLPQAGGGTLTLTVSCEREQWRLSSSDSPEGIRFYRMPFLAATGIARTWVCSAPARVLE